MYKYLLIVLQGQIEILQPPALVLRLKYPSHLEQILGILEVTTAFLDRSNV